MERIKEDYCNFEISKLLKEKGFKGEGEHFYENNKIIDYINYWDRITPKQRYEAIEAPTLQTAMKWLREVHNIHLVPKFDFYAGDYTGRIYDGRRENSVEKDDYIAIVGNRTYEQACEASIKYCLENLI